MFERQPAALKAAEKSTDKYQTVKARRQSEGKVNSVSTTTPVRPRAPWWIYLLAIAFAAAFCFDTYEAFMGYAGGYTLGAEMADAPKGGARIESVTPGTPMDKAGVRTGDVVVAADGQKIRVGHDFGDLHWNLKPQKAVLLTVERNGQRIALPVVFVGERRIWETLDRSHWVQELLTVALGLTYLTAGCLVLFARPRDLSVIFGAILLFALAPDDGFGTIGYAITFKRLPVVLQGLIFLTKVVTGGYLLLLFAALFPRPVFRRGWMLLALVAPGLLSIPNNSVRYAHRIFMPGHEVFPGPAWHFQAQIALEVAYIVAGFVVFAIGYKRLRGLERLRARKVLLGAAITFGTLVLSLLRFALDPILPPAIDRFIFSGAVDLALLLPGAFFPIMFAQAVLMPKQQTANAIAPAS